ncbi:ATP-binding cassette domain-containing protein [Streptomyces althioticus]|uniref:ABC transporter ATP-binding protein n=1 Tax=Streptomyces TaxID=1883 RepID=UPI0033FF97DB
MAAVEADELHRVFPRRKGEPVEALGGVSLSVPRGEVHGLLGPNGAGKTTLCKILATVLLPTSGTARVCGHDVVADTARVRRLTGIVFGGEKGLYQRLTPRQNLTYWAALYRLPRQEAARRTERLLRMTGLEERADDPVETFSRGMKQRLHLARGLLADPQLVILDEPTTGMDPVGARAFRDLIGQLKEEGRTVLITTHDMSEAEAVCDRVSLISDGRLIATEDPRTIGGWITRYEWIEAEGVPGGLLESLARMPGVIAVSAVREGVTRIESEGVAREVLRLLVDAGVTRVRSAPPSLEDVYLHVIGDRGMAVR